MLPLHCDTCYVVLQIYICICPVRCIRYIVNIVLRFLKSCTFVCKNNLIFRYG